MSRPKLSISRINAVDQQAFVEAFGFLFEGSPWIASEAWRNRPFASIGDLHEKLCAVIYTATREQQLALIRAHPDLVGRAALSGTLTPQSTGEQAAAGLDRLSPVEIAHFTQLNAAYRDKFGFPFVICARENKKESTLSGFAARLPNALDEIAKIARLRLLDIASDDS